MASWQGGRSAARVLAWLAAVASGCYQDPTETDCEYGETTQTFWQGFAATGAQSGVSDGHRIALWQAGTTRLAELDGDRVVERSIPTLAYGAAVLGARLVSGERGHLLLATDEGRVMALSLAPDGSARGGWKTVATDQSFVMDIDAIADGDGWAVVWVGNARSMFRRLDDSGDPIDVPVAVSSEGDFPHLDTRIVRAGDVAWVIWDQRGGDASGEATLLGRRLSTTDWTPLDPDAIELVRSAHRARVATAGERAMLVASRYDDGVVVALALDAAGPVGATVDIDVVPFTDLVGVQPLGDEMVVAVTDTSFSSDFPRLPGDTWLYRIDSTGQTRGKRGQFGAVDASFSSDRERLFVVGVDDQTDGDDGRSRVVAQTVDVKRADEAVIEEQRLQGTSETVCALPPSCSAGGPSGVPVAVAVALATLALRRRRRRCDIA